MQAQPRLCHCGVPKNLNLSGLGLGSACKPRARLGQSPGRATYSLRSVDWESTRAVSGGKPSVSETLQTSASDICCSVPPSPQHDLTSEPK